MLAHWIWLVSRKNLRYSGMRMLLEHFGSVSEIYYADEAAYALADGLKREQIRSLLDKNLDGAEKILADCYDRGIRILTIQDALYPEKLRSRDDAPPVLYYKGTIPLFDTLPVIGLVGTRRASAYGMVTAKRLGYQLARDGALIVSGMARGIDAAGAEGALTGGASVVGVLGCGADRIYPRENKSLYADVMANGCLISQFPPGTPPLRENFPIRNKIISGLSDGILVVEAGIPSGALITARDAFENGRDIFAVPGNLGVETSRGTNRLIRECATLVRNSWDVLEQYTARYPEKLVPHKGGEQITLRPEELESVEKTTLKVAQPAQKPEVNWKNTVDNLKKSDYIDVDEVLPTLPPLEAEILKLLREKPMYIDDLIESCQQPASQMLAAMTMLELKQFVVQLPGRCYALAQKHE